MPSVPILKIVDKKTGAKYTTIDRGDRERDTDEPHIKLSKRRDTAEGVLQRWLSNYNRNLNLVIVEMR